MPTSRTGQRNISRDRSRVAGGQGYELGYFARKRAGRRHSGEQQ